MHIALLRALCLVSCLFIVQSVQASEKDELALVIKQLDQMQASLERARVVAVQDEQSRRFYFDYLRVTQDINTIRKGIEFYLEPSRAQPTTSSVSGQYRQESQ
ncbi:RAQPRD family integrative conjugative element protein [Yersinia enterocolitica]|uniref:integrative conjugative element protein, RAQPRD family n=1 Tax=Yersinia TaxID=629 RepID=UPI0011AB622F|nr:RAQPRD family integrative conjugative element protein [Yersinia bercovieri]EKN3342819.1 conjugal transfer protein [Yersinia enterocolitica]EKN5021384.1 conjugal transfer protein [Yersinia enterocolitica]EKN5065957.1 conjugal transfer protein [Yersinia enterocolitica]EKN5131648.1 conjugal transfer protein [Yersinia enterocolitica]HDL6991980.1 conjugal transfer protein [Yersinia enterocolitica]